MSEFRNRRVVITGACGVHGQRFAAAFAAAGARVCLSDNRANRLESLRAALAGEGHWAHATELTNSACIDALVAQAAAKWNGVDIVVNNAGIYPAGHLIDLPVEAWDRIWAVNLRAPFLVARGFALLMARQGIAGSILNVGSGAARNMQAGSVPYCASKTALVALTRGMALEFAPFGIRVNTLEPGFAAGSEVSPLRESRVTRTLAGIPLGRPSGELDSPAAALFLSSAAASYITGAVLSVDGGNSVGRAAEYPDDFLEGLS